MDTNKREENLTPRHEGRDEPQMNSPSSHGRGTMAAKLQRTQKEGEEKFHAKARS